MNRKLIGTKFYVIILSLIFLMGCQSREKKMKTDIEAANKAYCPMNFGNLGSLNSMEFDLWTEVSGFSCEPAAKIRPPEFSTLLSAERDSA